MGHQWIIGNHHFAMASSECIKGLLQNAIFVIASDSEAISNPLINKGLFRRSTPRNDGISVFHRRNSPINVYRDGNFIAAVMISHSINEGIIVFVADRVKLSRNKSDGGAKSIEDLIDELEHNKTISKTCADAARGIYGSYRNDVHHMSSKVSGIDFPLLARENLKRLAVIEGELFGVDVTPDGKLKPHAPFYWDLNPDGMVSAFLRLE